MWWDSGAPSMNHMLKVSDDKNVLAFLTNDNRVVVVVYNPEAANVRRSLKIGDKNITVMLKAKSINTLVV